MDVKKLVISLYFGVENLYYNILDQINKVIPVYKYAIHPLEKRGIPSMPTYLGLIILLILATSALGAFLVLNNNANKVTLTITTIDSLGFKVAPTVISYTSNGDTYSVETDSNGVAKLNLKKGYSLILQINADGYNQKTLEVKPSQNEKITITLKPSPKKEEALSTQIATEEEFRNAGLETPQEAEKRFLEETSG